MGVSLKGSLTLFNNVEITSVFDKIKRLPLRPSQLSHPTKRKISNKTDENQQGPPKKRTGDSSSASTPMIRVKLESELLPLLVFKKKTGESSKTTTKSGPSPANSFSCDSCKAIFSQKLLLSKHICKPSRIDPDPLHITKSLGKDKIQFRDHHKLVSTGKFVCDYCPCVTSNQSSIRRHISLKHADLNKSNAQSKKTDTSDSEDETENQEAHAQKSSTEGHPKSKSHDKGDKIQYKGHHKLKSTGEFVCDYCQCVTYDQSLIRKHILIKHVDHDKRDKTSEKTDISDSEDESQKTRDKNSSSKDHSKSKSHKKSDKIQFKGYHMLKSSGDYVCNYCQMIMSNQSSIRSHVTRKHLDLEKSDTTSKKTDTSDSEDESQKTQDENSSSAEHLKSKSHKKSDKIQFKGYHMLKSTGDYVCDYCQMILSKQSSIRSHVIRKHVDPEKSDATPKKTNTTNKNDEPKYQWVRFEKSSNENEDALPLEVVKVELGEGTTTAEELKKIEIVQKLFGDSNRDKMCSCPCCPYESKDRTNFRNHVRRQHREIYLKSGHVKLKSKPLESSSAATSQADDNRGNSEGEGNADGRQVEQRKREIVSGVKHKCLYCPFETLVRGTLRSHVDRVHRKREHLEDAMIGVNPPGTLTGYACNLCSFIGCNVPSLRRHVNRTHDDLGTYHGQIPVKSFDCDMCSFQCAERRAMKTHFEEHKFKPDENGRYKCRDCDFDANLEGILLTHVSMFHPPIKMTGIIEPIQCDFCDYSSANSRVMDWHKEQHNLPSDQALRILTCNDCGFFTWRKDYLANHIRRRHVEPGEGSGIYSGLKSEPLRKKVRGDYDPTPCDQCSYVAKTKSMLKFHVVRKHPLAGSTDYECDQCGKKFKLKYDLTHHVKVKHMDDKVWICDVCGQTYRTHNGFYTHQRYAHFKYEFPCHLCRKRLATQANLDDHILKQHEQRQDFICEECGKVFKESRTLKVHLRIHTGLKPHVCQVCNRAFVKKTGLRQHMLIHSDQRLYICDICGKSYAQKTGLICHRKSHPGPLPPLAALPKSAVDRVLNSLLQRRELASE